VSTEYLILSQLVHNDQYGSKVIPFLKEEYFNEKSYKTIFSLIKNFVNKYSAFPTKETLFIELDTLDTLDERLYKESQELISNLVAEDSKLEWLLDTTEKFCQDKSIYNAIYESIKILEDKEGKSYKGSIPKLLQDALAVTFDSNIGHDFIDDWESRYDYYHTDLNRIPFDIKLMNDITGGGVPNKTLSVILAGTNVGKTAFMTHCAGNNLRDGYNVLYITLEMREEEISKRIDANLLDITMNTLKELSKEVYEKKIDRIRSTTKGKLIVKEYPTASASVGNFRHLLNELRLKKNFSPDIIYIDYINICASSRIKHGNRGGSYEYIKAVAEEIRGLSGEFDLPIITATQVNRSGFTSSDIGLEDTAESFGLPATADLMIALISTEELEDMNQLMVKQLKNRLSDKSQNKKFMIGIDRSKMRFFDVDDSAQDDLLDGPSPFDNSSFGDADNERSKPKSKFKFDGFQ
jgi:replicative DNA helicase